MSVGGATVIGCVAIVIWSSLAALTALSGAVPPFQLVAMSFAVAALLGLVYLWWTGSSLTSLLRVPSGAWFLGVSGLIGYHFLYFLALRTAPAVEANLINYLWPLLIVLFSALLAETRAGGGLKWWHVTGAAFGFCGTALIVTQGGGEPESQSAPWTGYAAALAAALTWSAYSVANRRFARVSSTAVTGFCFATAILAACAHSAFEDTVWPSTALEWASVLGMGLGPVGASFYVWDYGTKHGDIRVLGAAAYATPLLSTFLLVALGISGVTPALWLACLLITGGAVLAARDLLFRTKS